MFYKSNLVTGLIEEGLRTARYCKKASHPSKVMQTPECVCGLHQSPKTLPNHHVFK